MTVVFGRVTQVTVPNVVNTNLAEARKLLRDRGLVMQLQGDPRAGKVLGVGAVGLTQIGIWIVAGLLVAKLGLLSAGVSFAITPVQVAFFILFFLLDSIIH